MCDVTFRLHVCRRGRWLLSQRPLFKMPFVNIYVKNDWVFTGETSRYFPAMLVKTKHDVFLTLTECFLYRNLTRAYEQCCDNLRFKIKPNEQ